MNIEWSKKILLECQQAGVQEYCICAGARNSPLVATLSQAQGVRLYSFFDERSAAFFATGRIQATQRPVAVITTSGTAVAELLPATVEAHYSGWPLLLITADRPRSYRGSGAPQAILQTGIFSHYVEFCADLEFLTDKLNLQEWSLSQPAHINICFSEPLIDAEVPTLDLTEVKPAHRTQFFQGADTVKKLESPVVLLTRLSDQARSLVLPKLLEWKIPIYAEVLANLRGDPALKDLLIEGDEEVLHKGIKENRIKSVIRIGGIPTLRLWRDLEDKYLDLPVVSVSDLEFKGLSRPSHLELGWHRLNNIQVQSSEALQELLPVARVRAEKIKNTLSQFPLSEQGMLHSLLPYLSGKTIYVGNSLPIRHWDLVNFSNIQYQSVYAARGANGIDGQLSAYLGISESVDESWAIVGDLTALYDLQALWITNQQVAKKRRIVVINNSGGMIFKRMFQNPLFLNQHQLGFQKWAEMFSWSYIKLYKIEDMQNLPDQVIIELIPDAEQTEKLQKQLKDTP